MTTTNAPKMPWEKLGISQHEFGNALSATMSFRQRLIDVENHINEALHFVAAIENDEELSAQSWDMCMVAKRALKKARKKMQRYYRKQTDRDILGYLQPLNLKD